VEKKSELVRRVHSIRSAAREWATQARVVMSVLVLALLGGSAELARCPQLVSFSRATLPESAETQTRPVGYQPATFHNASTSYGSAHETLLKASMPINRDTPPAVQKTSKHRRSTHTPVLLRSKQPHARIQQVSRLLVLSSWDEQQGPRMVFAVAEQRITSTSYAAVPTAGGWLVIQL
jgi:hypothetical protein